jgi:hypothetical protein
VGAHVRRDQQRVYWRLIRQGCSAEEAARRVGFNSQVGRRWLRQAGGMPPLSLIEPVRSRKLNISEREQIVAGISAEKSIRQIAAELGRHPSTVLRELRKNMHHQQYRRRSRRRLQAHTLWNYSPHLAQLRADKKASRPKQAKLATDAWLQAEVQDRLQQTQPGADRSSAGTGFPRRSEDAGVPRDHLPIPLRARPRRVET